MTERISQIEVDATLQGLEEVLQKAHMDSTVHLPEQNGVEAPGKSEPELVIECTQL